MRFAYYPGCSARSTCAELNEATHRVAAGLGLDLIQLDSATCTGARELRAIDPVGFYTLNVRILALAERHGLPLMTICNTCTLNVLDAHAAFVDDSDLAAPINGRLADEGLRYSGRTRISHFLWVLYEDIGEARLRELVKRPLTGLTVAAFYGCHITRPPARYKFVDSRNNIALERLAEILGCLADRLQRPHRVLRLPYRRPRRAHRDQAHRAAHSVGQGEWCQDNSDALPALSHRARQLPARDRTGYRPEARHAGSAPAAACRPCAWAFARGVAHRPAHGQFRPSHRPCLIDPAEWAGRLRLLFVQPCPRSQALPARPAALTHGRSRRTLAPGSRTAWGGRRGTWISFSCSP